MRVALVAESFLPQMNGVVNSVLQVTRNLTAAGHEVMVLAPGPGERARGEGAVVPDAATVLTGSLPLPSYPDVRVGLARAARLRRILRDHAPDVVHLASPFVLGWQALVAARSLRIATVAVYQTDVVAYAQRYGVPAAAPLAARHVTRLHRRSTLTLAPSAASLAQLQELGVDRLRLWGRGVDAERFDPSRRSEAWRRTVAPGGGEVLIGYAGRLAAEKQVEDLRVLSDLPGTRLVVIGDGPERERLRALLPGAHFTGFLSGEALATAVAGLDVFVHPGESETFGQTIQEAHASGVPVVATGRGGPLDLVRNSVDGWLYAPGDLADLRARVSDLVGDEGKRQAFARAARAGVHTRSWAAQCERLLDHYDEAQALRPLDDALLAPPFERLASPHRPAPRTHRPRWTSYVALGDSITEGLCDDSRSATGEYRGWADRLAQLIAQGRGGSSFRYANLAVRSRTVAELREEQLPRALEMAPSLVSVLIGANDLVRWGADPRALADEVDGCVRRLRAAGADVLLVTPFLPRRRASALFARRFAAYSAHLRRIARETGAILLDLDAVPELGEAPMWAADRVHLCPRGHRFLSYRAAEVLRVPLAEALGGLEAAFHDDEPEPAAVPMPWLRAHALPWVWRRLRGRRAGDGLGPKHEGYVELLPASRTARLRSAR